MTMDGYGPYQIAKALKEDKVEIPAVHMAKKDAGLWKGRVEEIKDPYGWGSSTVAGILKKREYLGHTVNFKTRKHFKTKGVKADMKALESAVKAVESSKLDKTVADADGLYKATEGNVQDEKTREALKQAIAKRDAGAIAKAVKSVNDSKAAKEKADAGS